MTGEPEGQRADWMVEKLAELGVTLWLPLSCARSPWPAAPARLDRWDRLATAALRQSRAAWRMEVQPPVEVAAALEALPEGGQRWLADPDGEPPPAPEGGAHVVAVGPAQGFDDRERERLARAGFRPVCLAGNRLRTETAAVAWASWRAFGALTRRRSDTA
jgi:16S rRNA (uracil1498-N3)-methyltransferase